MADLQSVVWLLLGGITRLFSFGRWTIPLAEWLVPLCLIRFLRGTNPFLGALAVWLVLWIAISISNRSILYIPDSVYYAVSAIIAASFTLPYLANTFIAPNIPGFAATLVFPLAWVTMELIVARTNPLGTWGALAYSQYGNRVLMQLVSVTGLAGIAFLVSWFGSVVNWAWAAGFDWEVVGTGVCIYAGVFLSVMLGGGARLVFAAATAKTVRAAAIGWPKNILRFDELEGSLQPEMSADMFGYYQDKFEQIQDWFLDHSVREARAGARVIVWPENNLVVYQEDYEAFIQRAREVARQEDVYLLMGIACIQLGESRPFEPQAVLIDPSGEVLFTYVKNRLVPGWEANNSKSGDGRVCIADSPYGRIVAVICYDMDFPDLIRQVGKAGADMLLVPVAEPAPPANVGILHHRMSTFRAIENGVSIVRASRLGLSSAVDPYGQIHALMDDAITKPPIMLAQVPVSGIRTLYAKVGDTFAWLCAVGLVGVIVWGIIR